VDDEIINSELSIISLLHLADLLLFEFRLLGKQKILRELDNLVEQLLTLAKDQNLHSLLAETYLLQSRLFLLELNYKQAGVVLLKALKIAKKRDLRKLENLIDQEVQLLPKWENIIEQKPQAKEIVDLAKIDDLIDQMIHRKVHKDEKEIKKYVMEAKNLLDQWKKT
jgi:hypothetical protein